MRIIQLTAFGSAKSRSYTCQYDWDKDCIVQGGDSGIVFSKKGNYKTAFFEVFPKGLDSYFRGEGITIEVAEKNAWEKYQKVVLCEGHEFERNGYTNGVGYCKHCGLRKDNAFEPDQYCEVCGQPTNYTMSKSKKWYCENHRESIPDNDKTDFQKGKEIDPLGFLFGNLE